MTKIGIMVCGHGSRSLAAVEEFAVVADRLTAHFPENPVSFGYLEFANPVVRSGLDDLRGQGCDHILAVPGMLFAAMHAKNDIPTVLNTYAKEHGIRVEYGRELGIDPKMIAAAADRIRHAMAEADATHGPVPAEETCLVVIGRGSSDPDANGNISKVGRMLQEGMGLGWLEIGYSGLTFPLVEPCLDHSAKLGYKRIIVFPYFLFTGVLIDRIYGFTDEAAARYPDIQFQKADYLNDHPKVIETFAERAWEILEGSNHMNCTMCKYRSQVPGFESEVGLKQESHHLHVEGQGANAPGTDPATCDLCGTFCTGVCKLPHEHEHGHTHHHPHVHDHDHDHHHPPYPQARHPHGPESVRKRLKS